MCGIRFVQIDIVKSWKAMEPNIIQICKKWNFSIVLDAHVLAHRNSQVSKWTWRKERRSGSSNASVSSFRFVEIRTNRISFVWRYIVLRLLHYFWLAFRFIKFSTSSTGDSVCCRVSHNVLFWTTLLSLLWL